jgi:hypothetical protein
VQRIPFDVASRIARGERDHELSLNTSAWPSKVTLPPSGWTKQGNHLVREIVSDSEKDLLALPLVEALLRFPAAPIHGVQRLHESHNSAGGGVAQNSHSYRILTRPDFVEPADRVFIFHNGLNELDRVGLYYQLASQLLAEPESRRTACVLRPFPGHLTRFPYYRFAETPLDRYLWDGSHLFRQFLRYMIETQWFLSVLTTCSDFRLPSGASLLSEGDLSRPNRLDPDVLSRAMDAAWKTQYSASRRALRVAFAEQDMAPGMEPMPRGRYRFREDVLALRNYLGLNVAVDEADDRLKADVGDAGERDAQPAVHVIGYSLGGFLAQSVFMSWPFLVDSCSTLFSGGPLRELAPTAFAHPEEWQTVMHSLRYEMDEAMISGRLVPTRDAIAGIPRSLFLFLQRTFYEVFQQDYRGSYQSRLTELRGRMLFVVGGDDPIVKTKSVLDAEPPGGINLLEISGLGHFLGAKPRTPEEASQRKYWMPEIGRVLSRFADASHDSHSNVRKDAWLGKKNQVVPSLSGGRRSDDVMISDIERGVQLQDGALSSRLFERYLDELLEWASVPGYLFVLRNEVPTFMLDDKAVQQRASALYHDDEAIVGYCRGVQARRAALEANRDRISVVLPWNARRIHERMDAPLGYPSQSETAPGEMPTRQSAAETWSHCESFFTDLTTKAEQSVMVFDGRRLLVPARDGDSESGRADDVHKARSAIIDWGIDVLGTTARPDRKLRIASLPDCWIWASGDFLEAPKFVESHEAIRRFIGTIGDRYKDAVALRRLLRREELRVVSVSRSRYNPRFRGRLVTDEEAVKPILLHAALCLSAARSARGYDWLLGEESAYVPGFVRTRSSDRTPDDLVSDSVTRS